MPGIVGERPAAGSTTVIFVPIPPLGKITCGSTYALTRARSLSAAISVTIAPPQRVLLRSTWGYTPGRSLLLAPFAPTGPHTHPLCATTWQSTRIRCNQPHIGLEENSMKYFFSLYFHTKQILYLPLPSAPETMMRENNQREIQAVTWAFWSLQCWLRDSLLS